MNRKTKISFVLFILALSSLNSYAQEEKYISLFVYNFTKYFDWPPEAKSGEFLIQVIGHKSVFDELKHITAGKSVGAQQIVVQSIKSVAEIKSPHILFIGHWQSRLIQEILPIVNDAPTLLIAEREGMLDEGAGLNFVIRDGSIQFEIKTKNVSVRKLKTDPRIRELAYKVIDD